MHIGEPTVLSRLPRAGLTGEGNTRFAQVYGVRYGQRKKRQELCAAIDGNSVNLYEVVSGRNITSWPVPPDTVFVCDPVSDRLLLEDGSFVRRSWCVARRQNRLTAQIFEESNKASQVLQHSSKSRALSHEGEVLRIDSSPAGTEEAFVTYADGTIICISSSKDSSTLQTSTCYRGANVQLQQSCWLSADEAVTTVLKSRQDLISSLPSSSVLLVAVCSISGSRHPHLACWRLTPTGAEGSIEPLFCHSLSTCGIAKKVSFEFIASCKQLKVTSSPCTTYVDLTTIVPQKLSERKTLPSEHKSAIALTSEVDAYLASGDIRLFNHKYNALLASRRIDNTTLKRKRDGSNGQAMTPVAYFSQIQRIVAFLPSQLIAIDLTSSNDVTTELKRSSLLINNILRGEIDTQSTSPSRFKYKTAIGKHRLGKTASDWALLSGDLENLVAQNDVEGFTIRFAEAFDVHNANDMKNFKYGQDKLDFLLNMLFMYDSTASQSLSVSFKAHSLLKWAVSAGLLEGYRVARAVGVVPGNITSIEVARAILGADTTELDLLESFLRDSPYLEAETLTFVVLYLITEIRRTSESDQPAHNALESTRISPDMSTGSEAATKCLILALQRLSYAGSKTVSAQLASSTMQQVDIIALIQFLRQQLFQGGFYRMGGATAYPSPPTSQNGHQIRDEQPRQSSQLSLDTIVCILDGCIDAIGPVGVLGADEGETFLRAMVTELCSEIASTSEAVQDSVALQGLVRETLRYIESVERQPFEVRQQTEQPRDGQTAVKGQIVTLYAEHNPEETGQQFGPALPLSLKAEESDITSHKTRRGGQTQRRSTREIGMLKDRLKAPYSFERLVL